MVINYTSFLNTSYFILYLRQPNFSCAGSLFLFCLFFTGHVVVTHCGNFSFFLLVPMRPSKMSQHKTKLGHFFSDDSSS